MRVRVGERAKGNAKLNATNTKPTKTDMQLTKI